MDLFYNSIYLSNPNFSWMTSLFLAGSEGQIHGCDRLLCWGQRLQPDPGAELQKIKNNVTNHLKCKYIIFSVCFFFSWQLLQIQWTMCFLCGEASRPWGESSTQYDTFTPHVVNPDAILFLNRLTASPPQIIRKSCIEILAAEPSSVCAGGKRCKDGVAVTLCNCAIWQSSQACGEEHEAE